MSNDDVVVDLTNYKLDVREKKVRENLDKGCKVGALYLEKPLKEECPVLSGALQESISTRQDGEAEWSCKAGEEYAPYVIHGTSKQKANNFPARVLKSEKENVKKLIKETVLGE